MKRLGVTIVCIILCQYCFCWGFYAHRKINYYAIFLLPPEMLVLYKPNISFLSEHAVDPDKRRYLLAPEASRHFIDLDHYGKLPFDSLPRKWSEAIAKFGEDSLRAYGIVPWWIQTMLERLTNAFKQKDKSKILKLSAEIGHYISDAHVPLHANSNHNGQFTAQEGIHAFWESRIPELLAEKDWDFLIGKAVYISNPSKYIWKKVLESAAASDSVLRFEKQLSQQISGDKRYSFEYRNGILIKQYSTEYTLKYNEMLNDMVERRMRESILSVASFWFTAWVNAGQPDLKSLNDTTLADTDVKEFEELEDKWKRSGAKEH